MHDIIDGAKDALNAAILLGGVWAQHAEDGAMSEEERAGRGVIKLTDVVAMDGLDGGAKLCVRIGKKNWTGEGTTAHDTAAARQLE